MSCFSAVELKLIKVSGSVLKGDLSHWVKVDLVNSTSGNQFNEFWCTTTQRAVPQVRKMSFFQHNFSLSRASV
jgi:hypothetical protein